MSSAHDLLPCCLCPESGVLLYAGQPDWKWEYYACSNCGLNFGETRKNQDDKSDHSWAAKDWNENIERLRGYTRADLAQQPPTPAESSEPKPMDADAILRECGDEGTRLYVELSKKNDAKRLEPGNKTIPLDRSPLSFRCELQEQAIHDLCAKYNAQNDNLIEMRKQFHEAKERAERAEVDKLKLIAQRDIMERERDEARAALEAITNNNVKEKSND